MIVTVPGSAVRYPAIYAPSEYFGRVRFGVVINAADAPEEVRPWAVKGRVRFASGFRPPVFEIFTDNDWRDPSYRIINALLTYDAGNRGRDRLFNDATRVHFEVEPYEGFTSSAGHVRGLSLNKIGVEL